MWRSEFRFRGRGENRDREARLRERRLKWIGLALLLAVPLFIWAQGSATKNLSITVAPAPGGSFGIGWTKITGSTAATVAPSTVTFPGINGSEGYAGVMNDWNGGSVDSKRNRLIFWGGGHAGYYGNEVYAFDPVNTPHIFRLTDPATPPTSQCNGTAFNNAVWPNTTPNITHGYKGATYMPTVDQITYFMGDLSRGTNGCPSSAVNDSLGRFWGGWLFKLNEINQAALPNASGHWLPLDPFLGGSITYRAHNLCTAGSCTHLGWARDGTPLGEYASTDWDPVTQMVIVYDQFSIYAYDPANNSAIELAASGALNTSSTSAVGGAVDPQHRYYMAFGNGIARRFHLDTFSTDTLDGGLTNCTTPKGIQGPGLVYDATMGLFVVWGTSADTQPVWLFNASDASVTTANYGTVGAKSCVQLTPALISGTKPPAPPNPPGGINGHFHRISNLSGQDIFPTCTDMDKDCYVLALNATSTSGHQTFAQRVAGTQGLVYSNSLDTTAKVNEGSIVASSQGPIRVSLNTLVSPPGDGLSGSLQFFAPSTCTGTRCSGDWESPIWNTSMGPPTHPGLNPDLYMQIRVMRDANYAATDWVTTGGNGQKMFILHNGSTTCASIEGTLEDTFQRGYLQMYTDCGGQAFVKDLGNGDFLREQSTPIDSTTNNQMRYNCHANFQSGIECAYYEGRSSSALQYANGWMTIEVHFHFTGEWSGSTPNTTVTAWVSYDKGTTMPDGTVSDGSAHQWMNFQPHFNCNNTPGCVATSSNEGFNRIDLLNYETNGAPTGRTTDGFLYYSALIVATGTIPFPDGWTPQ
jgi:hypothetical protein